MSKPKIGVFGAGAIGCYVGVLLSQQGHPTTLVGRRSILDVADQLQVKSIAGRAAHPGHDLVVTDAPDCLSDVDICLVTVKSKDTVTAAQTLARVLRPEALVCSFQNGLRNPRLLRDGGLEHVLAGMVSFNVFRNGGTLVQATSGPLVLGQATGQQGEHLRALQSSLVAAGEQLELRADIEAVQAGKLLVNLNNGVCALTGVSIAESLRLHPLRRSFAACIREGLSIYKAAGLKTARVGRLSPRLMSRLLPLPNAVVLRVAPSLVAIDPQARSSTLQDLEAGKLTEIDDLNGELVRIADEHGAPCPINRWVTEQVHRLEAAGLPVPFLKPEQLWSTISPFT